MGAGDISRTRRSVLHTACYAIATAIAEGSLARSARAQSEAKMTKARAEYQGIPNGIYSCATYTLFVAPNACKVVEGEVSPDGWCKAYAMAD
jgi:hypothetical protein